MALIRKIGKMVFRIRGNKTLPLHKPVLAWFILILSAVFSSLFAQTPTDSLNKIFQDSLARIPFQISAFRADLPGQIRVLDSAQQLLADPEVRGVHLNRFYGPEFRPLLFAKENRIWDHGWHSAAFKNGSVEEYSFLAPNKPVSEIVTHRGRSFTNSQASFQDNFDIGLVFAAPFRDQLLWNFSYDKQNYKGIYSHDAQKNTRFATGVHFTGKQKRWRGNILFADERHFADEHWGIQNDSFLANASYKIREALPVRITSAKNKITERSVGLNLRYAFRDVAKENAPGIAFKSAYTDYAMLYEDPETRNSQEVYGAFWIDSQSITQNLKFRLWANETSIVWLERPGLRLSTLGRYEYSVFDPDTLSENFHRYRLALLAHYDLGAIRLQGSLAFKNTQTKGLIEAALSAQYQARSFLHLELGLESKGHEIPYGYQHFFLNKKAIWNSSFDDRIQRQQTAYLILSTSGIRFPVKARLEWSGFSTFAHLDTASFPRLTDDVHVLSAHLSLPVHWRWIRFENSFEWQQFTPEELHYGGWNSGHSISLNTRLFKSVVDADFGVGIQLFDYPHRLRYNPLIQGFYPSDLENELFYTMRAFMRFQVSEFTLSLDAENLDALWNTDRPYLVDRYPVYDFFFRFGIRWRFLN